MLLYDHLMEYCHRKIKADEFGKWDLARFAYMRAAKVYELSSVAPLFQDWEREKVKRVPRKPPHLPLWAEWEYHFTDGTGMTWDWQIGAVIYRWPYSAEKMNVLTLQSGRREEILGMIGEAEELYGTQIFRRLLKVPNLPPEERNNPKIRHNFQKALNMIFTDVDGAIWALKDNGAQIEGFRVCANDRKEEDPQAILELSGDLDVRGVFKLPVLSQDVGAETADPFFVPWPMFLSFALLHCKNVGTQEHVPDERTQRQVRRAGNPPRVTYKTLHVTVPQMQRARRPEGEGTGARVRWHICSGHMKHLTAACYKEPGWYWWNSHWRGDPALGTVFTDTKVEA